mmetsp:Transcript_12439/g.41261  ORF Transcript_12439/g.41261 Transcript_12439/m.41261 type:complete len:221 (-) Transcript_12439:248-910(-)
MHSAVPPESSPRPKVPRRPPRPEEVADAPVRGETQAEYASNRSEKSRSSAVEPGLPLCSLLAPRQLNAMPSTRCLAPSARGSETPCRRRPRCRSRPHVSAIGPAPRFVAHTTGSPSRPSRCTATLSGKDTSISDPSSRTRPSPSTQRRRPFLVSAMTAPPSGDGATASGPSNGPPCGAAVGAGPTSRSRQSSRRRAATSPTASRHSRLTRAHRPKSAVAT